MSTWNARTENETSPKAVANGSAKTMTATYDNQYQRVVTTEPKLHSWMIVAAGAVVPLGLGITAAATTYINSNERVSIAAWVAVAVVGSAAVISAAAVSHRRDVTVGRAPHRQRTTERRRDRTRSAK